MATPRPVDPLAEQPLTPSEAAKAKEQHRTAVAATWAEVKRLVVELKDARAAFRTAVRDAHSGPETTTRPDRLSYAEIKEITGHSRNRIIQIIKGQ